MDINKKELFQELAQLFKNCPGNTVSEENALPGCEGLVMYEEPIFGVSDPADPLYTEFKKPEVIGDNFLLPAEWLPGAKSVIALFFPFTDRVKSSNRGDPEDTSSEWLHGRIEGQAFINAYMKRVKEYFETQGISACVPGQDPRFGVRTTELPQGDPKGAHIASNWSERHVAYASGLGTFCLTRGLISAKGVAGRYASIIISEKLEPDARPYTGVYDYCIMCGACIPRCPTGAITLEGGKNQVKCSEWVHGTKARYAPRYGCGKCQTGVPCESGIPHRMQQ